MPKKNVPVVYDDYDGKQLPDDTEPVNLSYMGQRFELYLSDKNASKLFDFLAEFTKEATPVYDHAKAKAAKAAALPRGAKSEYAEAKAEQMKTFRDWAKGQGIEVSESGAPKEKDTQAFYEVNANLPRLIGRGSLSVEEWHAQRGS